MQLHCSCATTIIIIAICAPRAISCAPTAPVSRAQLPFLSLSQAPGGPAYVGLFCLHLVIVSLDRHREAPRWAWHSARFD